MARDRLRRYQARSEGKLRLVPPPTESSATVVAGPIHDYDLDAVRRTVEELGGRLAIVVPRGPRPLDWAPRPPESTGRILPTMLADSLAVTTVAVTDVDRAKRFYQEQVGLTLMDETPSGCWFGAGKGSRLTVRRGQPNVGQTVAHFEVDDLDAVMRDLTSRGVVFEEYETPKTVNSIAQIGPARGAWFKDPDGNVFGLREGPRPAGW